MDVSILGSSVIIFLNAVRSPGKSVWRYEIVGSLLQVVTLARTNRICAEAFWKKSLGFLVYSLKLTSSELHGH